jgi:hypothetical protein
MSDKKTFRVRFNFLMQASTRGYLIEADSAEDALLKAESCIDEHGHLDTEKFAQLGGDLSQSSWNTDDGTDHGYSIDSDGIEPDD